jgi:hypothetical protein
MMNYWTLMFCEKLMEGKHTEIVINVDDDLKSINDTNTFSYSEQNNMTNKPCLGNNNELHLS